MDAADRAPLPRPAAPPVPEAALGRLTALAARLLGARTARLCPLPVPVLPDPLDALTATLTAGPGDPAAGPLVVPDARADARLRDLPPVAAGAVAAYLGVPLRGRGGDVAGVLCVADPAPRAWTADDVELLSDLAAAAATELGLAALAADLATARVRSELAVSAGGVGTFDWDVESGTLTWDAKLLEVFGYAPDDFGRTIDDFYRRLHPDDLARVGDALNASVEHVGGFAAEYRVVRPDGTTRWVRARGQALAGESGRTARLLGAAYDTTAAHDEDARVARVLESMSSAFFSLDRQWRFSYVNSEAERVLGRSRAELLGGEVWELFPDAVGSPFEEHYRGVAASGRPVTFEAHYPAPLDAWYEVRAWPDPDGVSVYFLDITERRRAQRTLEAAHAEAAAAAERLRLIVRVSEDLSSTLEVEDAYARLAQHLVPELGDWCLVTLVDDAGGLRDLGCHHADPDRQDLVRAYREARLTALSPNSYLFRVWRTGRPVSIPSGAAQAIAAQLDERGPARALIAALAPEAFVCLPVRARGRTVGLITLFHDEAGTGLSPEDLLLASEVADRAGLALDNARLYSQQHRVSEGLQRSLLTDPVQPDHVQVVVRYRPAPRAARVGGDWYDAFLTPDGATVLVIGDVMGHDVDAAAAMSQVRSLLRGIAYSTGGSPARVLSGLDAAMQGLDVGTTATAVVARLELLDGERRLRWSNAGHLGPVLVGPDGAVSTLGGEHAELLLGIDPAAARSDTVRALPDGSTVLAFTDGLIERRDRPLEEGLRLLHAALADLSGAGLDDLVDGVLRRMVPGEHEDDVAVLALRLHPQEGERPAEAGPESVPEALPPVR